MSSIRKKDSTQAGSPSPLTYHPSPPISQEQLSMVSPIFNVAISEERVLKCIYYEKDPYIRRIWHVRAQGISDSLRWF